MRKLAKVSLILLFAAVLGTVYFFGALGSKNASQIFQTEFESIRTASGNSNQVISFDGRFIAEYGDGYALYKGHQRLSSKFKNLRLINGAEGIYEYTTFDSYIGALDKNGQALTKLKLKGKPVNDLAAGAADFYYEYSAEGYRAVLEADGETHKSRNFSEVYTHSQLNLLWARDFTREVAQGVFGTTDGGARVLANVFNENTVALNSITAVGTNYIMVSSEGAYAVYSLPSLIKIDSGISQNTVFAKNDVFAYMKDALSLCVAGAGEYAVPFAPKSLVHSYNGNLLFTDGETAFILRDGTVKSGSFEGGSAADYKVYRVGNDIYNSRLQPILSGSSVKLNYHEGKAFLAVGNTFYSYDNVTAVKLYDSASSTYGDYGFLKRTLSAYYGEGLAEYEFYFNDGSAVYSAKGKKLATHSHATLFSDNLLALGDTFSDFKGKRTNGVQTFYRVYDTNGIVTGEYVFKKVDGYHSFDKRLFGHETLTENQPLFVKNSKGALVLISKDIIAVHDKIFRRSDYSFSGVFGDGIVFLANNDSITTVSSNAKKCAENTFAASGVSGVAFSAYGAVYTASNGLKGFIDSKGKSRIDPLYGAIECYEDNVIVTHGEYKALFSSDGQRLTDFDYTNLYPLGSYFFATRSDGKKQLFNSEGKEALKSVSGTPISVINYVLYNGVYVSDYEYSYYFVLSGGKYRLIKSAHEGYNNVNTGIWRA